MTRGPAGIGDLTASGQSLPIHYVFDLWAERWRRREAAGNMIIVRYADDFIVRFELETDARRFLDEMRKRLQEFALSLHSARLCRIDGWLHCTERANNDDNQNAQDLLTDNVSTQLCYRDSAAAAFIGVDQFRYEQEAVQGRQS